LFSQNNYKDFRKKISGDTYLAIDLTIAHANLDTLRKLFEDFPRIGFRIVQNSEWALSEVCDVFTEFKRPYIPKALLIEELVEKFKKCYR